MTEQVQVGDTVRLTSPIVSEVYKSTNCELLMSVRNVGLRFGLVSPIVRRK